jgi:hypothetical protein
MQTPWHVISACQGSIGVDLAAVLLPGADWTPTKVAAGACKGGDGTHFKGPLQLGLRGKVSERPQNRASIGALLEREKCAPTS